MVTKQTHRKGSIAGAVVLVAIFGALLFLPATPATVPGSSEAGFVSLSPNGVSGGAIIPASCESGFAHLPGDCQSCTSANACGQTNTGIIENGVCTASAPANPPGYGGACTGVNSCGQSYPDQTTCTFVKTPYMGNTFWCTSGGYTIGADGNCYTCTTTNPGAGTIQCNGSCSGATPPLPSGYGSACTSTANACGQTNSGTITCSGSCNASAPSNSSCPSTTATLTASPNPVAYGARSTLTWGSANATICTAGGPWSNASSPLGPSSGLTDPLTTDTTFTFQCTGPGGTSPLQSVTVTVACTGGCSSGPTGPICNNSATNPPACSTFTPSTATLYFKENNASIITLDNNGSATLAWTSTYTTSCLLNGTGVALNNLSGQSTGSLTYPQSPYNYVLACTGLGGPITRSATATVVNPDATISANPTRVSTSGATKITWTSEGTSFCTITRNGASWRTGLTGTDVPDTISTQTTYTITCQTQGGNTTVPKSVTVNVIPVFQEF